MSREEDVRKEERRRRGRRHGQRGRCEKRGEGKERQKR